MTTPHLVSRAPAGGITRPPHQRPGTAAGGAALDGEHGDQADQRAKGPHAHAPTNPHPVPSPAGQTDRRAQPSRVPAERAVKSIENPQFKTTTPECLLKNAVRDAQYEASHHARAPKFLVTRLVNTVDMVSDCLFNLAPRTPHFALLHLGLIAEHAEVVRQDFLGVLGALGGLFSP